MLRLSSLIVLLAVLPAAAQQRNPPPTPAQFHAALDTLNTSQAQWLKSIDSVKIEELPVSYAIGKQFEDSKALVTEDLKIAVLWANRADREHSFLAEVSFLSSVQDFQSQLQQFGALLDEFDVPEKAAQKRVSDWSQALNDIANGPVQKVWNTTYQYVTNRARMVDQSCAPRP